MTIPRIEPDKELANADWPKRTPDRPEDLGILGFDEDDNPILKQDDEEGEDAASS